MKKILSLLAFAALLALGFLLFQRHQVVKRLEEIAQGRSYRAYAVTIHIPRTEAKVRGFLTPYIPLERVSFDFAGWRIPQPVALAEGRLEGRWLGKERVVLAFPHLANQKGDTGVEGLAIGLGVKGAIEGVEADLLWDLDKAHGEKLSIHHPQMWLGPFVGTLPDYVTFSIAAIEFREERKGSMPELLKLGPIQFLWTSEKKGGDRHWKLTHSGKGGSFEEKSGGFQVKPWEFSTVGLVKELPREELVQFIESVAAELKKWSEMGETLPSDTQVQEVAAFYDRLISFLADMNFKVGTVDFRWEGLSAKYQEGGGLSEVEISPNEGRAVFEYGENRVAGSTHWGLKSLKIRIKDFQLDMQGLEYLSSGEYQLSYHDLVKVWLGYYRTLFISLKNPDPLGTMNSVMTSFAQYPDKALYELRVAQFDYKTQDAQGRHQNLKMAFLLDPKEIGATLRDHFDQTFTDHPENNIEKAQVDLALRRIFPWQKYLSVVREFAANGRPPLALGPILAGQLGGILADWKLDLGPLWYEATLNLKMLGDLAKTMLPDVTPEELKAPKQNLPISDYMWKKRFAAFLKDGTFELAVGMERFSRFQAMLNQLEPGSAAAMGLALPYVVVDPKADTFSFKVELKDGKVLLNGQPNEKLNEILGEVSGNSRLVSPP